MDFVTRDLLDAAGFATFCPTRTVETRWTDRTAITTRPLFPGYLFARFTPNERAAILATRGVVQILGTGTPEPIADSVIAGLRRAVDSPHAVALCPYVAGETVRVARGPFAGVAGVVTRVTGATTLTIPVEILGRAVSVQIAAEDIEENKK